MKLSTILVVLSTLIPISHAEATLSAYDRLRNQFLKAQAPDLRSLQTGEIWYCSDSLEAAKQQYSRVSMWVPKFIFQKNLMGKLVTVHLYSLNQSRELAPPPLRVTLANSIVAYFRVGELGQLLVEEVDFSSESSQLKSSISKPDALGSHYWVCESPSTHQLFQTHQ